MTTLRRAAEMALEALNNLKTRESVDTEIAVLQEALASQTVTSDCSDSHQPDAWMTEARNDLGLPVFFCASEVKQAGPGLIPLYTAPPQREWVDLTNEEIEWIKGSANRAIGYIRVTAAKLKEKNGP